MLNIPEIRAIIGTMEESALYRHSKASVSFFLNSLTFNAIDVETANADPGSICQMGV